MSDCAMYLPSMLVVCHFTVASMHADLYPFSPQHLVLHVDTNALFIPDIHTRYLSKYNLICQSHWQQRDVIST